MSDTPIEQEIDQEVKEKYKNSQMSKAGRLAMELSQERKRLAEELSQLQDEVDQLTPTTPVGTIDYYIKWASVATIVMGVFLQSSGLTLEGQISYLLGSLGWTIVGSYWNDKAIIIGSLIPATATALSIVQKLI